MGKPPEVGSLFILGFLIVYSTGIKAQSDTQYGCPPQERILPCRCSTRDMEFQIWCSHSELPKVLEGLEAIGHYIVRPIDELILENNNLPSLPGKVFATLRVLRLMLRNNRLERVSSGWLEGLHDSLLELFIVEPDLRSLPVDSLDNLRGLEAITVQSKSMKRLPNFSGLPKLKYLQINSPALLELSPRNFRMLPSLEQLHIFGSARLSKLDAGLLQGFPRLALVNISDCGVNWVHPRALVALPELKEISLVGNSIVDAGMIGRATIDLPSLAIIRLDRNRIPRLGEASFFDLPVLNQLYLSRNRITEILPGAFHRVPMLRTIDLNHNIIHRIHPEFFIQRTGSGLEELWLINNDLNHVAELRAILDALPRLKFLDMSHNQLDGIPFGAIRGHPTLERLHLDHNRISFLQRETFVAMPALRELRLRNNSLSNSLEGPFWNLPALKGLDLAENYFRHIEPRLLANLPSLRRLDISGNAIGLVEPESFIVTPALEHVNLSRNALSTLHPRTFRHLMNLYELDVSWNRLIEVVPGLPRDIEYLYMAMNRIVSLPIPPSSDLALPALRMLDLNANGVKRIIPGSLSTLPNLKRLKLGHNALQTLEDGSFDGLASLEQLDLRDNRLVSLHGRCFRSLRMLIDLNMKGNRLELIRPDLFQDNPRLQRLDLSKNKLAQIPHAAFATTRDLREIYTSYNGLTELPGSLHGLTALQVLDLSFNKLNILSPETLSSLTSLLELRLVKNRIQELREGAFSRLPRLSLIDLENNDLRVIERNAIRELPELQSLRLGKNHLQMIPNGAFTELPLLQSAELQENHLEEISSNAFINVPQLLFLNLSYNSLPDLEYAGLESLGSLEVLDLSNNRLSRVASESLAAMEWLVELKMDNNRICAVHGSPFNGMPRLRVLSLRNNRMASVSENAFKRLRSNIAVLDIDGNPLSCSCGMLWLRGWLQQASSEGPRCADGSLFREVRLSRQDCQRERRIESVVPGCEVELIGGSSLFGTSQIMAPSMNIRDTTPLPPLPNESEYFYEEYVDYPYENSTDDSPRIPALQTTPGLTEELSSLQVTPQPPEHITGGTPTLYAAPTPSVNRKNKTMPVPHKDIPPSPSSSGFTFFGVPLPSLNFNLWGNSARKADRKHDTPGRPGRARVHLFPPTEPEIHRGGFTPLLRGQSGFIPIVDPQLNHKMDNRTLQVANTNVSSQRVHKGGGSNAKRKQSTNVDKPPDNSKQPQATVEKASLNARKDQTTTRTRSKVTKAKNGTSALVTLKDFDDSASRVIESVNVTSSVKVVQATATPKVTAALGMQEGEEGASMVGGSQGEVASKIVWTTPSSRGKNSVGTDDGENVTVTTTPTTAATTLMTTTTEVLTTKKLSTFWDLGEWLRPKVHFLPTVPTRMVSSTTTTDYPTTIMEDLPLRTTPMQPEEQQTIPPVPSDKEASALSAFLVPGGQVPPNRPLGRSTITKVSSPNLNPVAEQYQNDKIPLESEKLLPEGTENNYEAQLTTRSSKRGKAPNFLEKTIGGVENAEIIEENPFSWYFQNYNDTNLEPYVGVVYSGVGRVNVNQCALLFAVYLISY